MCNSSSLKLFKELVFGHEQRFAHIWNLVSLFWGLPLFSASCRAPLVFVCLWFENGHSFSSNVCLVACGWGPTGAWWGVCSRVSCAVALCEQCKCGLHTQANSPSCKRRYIVWNLTIYREGHQSSCFSLVFSLLFHLYLRKEIVITQQEASASGSFPISLLHSKNLQLVYNWHEFWNLFPLQAIERLSNRFDWQ